MSRLVDVILRGDRASQPAATAVSAGALYFVTDQNVIERSDGSVWQTYSGTAATGSDGSGGSNGLFLLGETGGEDGIDGFPGLAGPAGAAGATGATGATGPSGAIVIGPRRYFSMEVGASAFRGQFAISPTTINNGAGGGSTFDSAGAWWRLATNSSSGNEARAEANELFVNAEGNPYMRMYVRTAATITSLRIWLGCVTQTPNNSDNLFNGTTRGLAFRYSTAAGDSSWVGVATNNAGNAQSVTSAIGSFGASTEYLLEITVTAGGTNAVFSVTPYASGVPTGGASTQTLSSLTAITGANEMKPWMAINTLTTATRNLDLRSWYFDGF